MSLAAGERKGSKYLLFCYDLFEGSFYVLLKLYVVSRLWRVVDDAKSY